MINSKYYKKAVCITVALVTLTALFTGCGEKKEQLAEVVVKEESVITNTIKKADFTYSIIDETYTEDGINIKFPQLTDASNTTKADSVNKAIQGSIRTKLDSVRMGQEDIGAISLDLKYEIMQYGNNVISISYKGTSHLKNAAYPVNIYYTQNITLDEVNTVPLKDIFIIDNNFIKTFKSGMYLPYGEDLNLEKSGVNLKETIESEYSNEDLVNLFKNNKVNYKLTTYGVILSIEVPHAIGDHLEMAIPYKVVESNMIKSSPVWESYLPIKWGV